MCTSLAFKAKIFVLVVLALVSLAGADDENRTVDQDQAINRDYSNDVDESSCICGLNKDILDRIESIVQKASSQSQFSLANNGPRLNETTSSLSKDSSTQTPQLSQESSQWKPSEQFQEGPKRDGSSTDLPSSNQNGASESLLIKLTNEIQSLHVQLTDLLTTSSIRNQNGPNQSSQVSSSLNQQGINDSISTGPISGGGGNGDQSSQPSQQTQQSLTGNNLGFLQGVLPNSNDSNQAQDQSKVIESKEVQQAVESTVPNVVANIFTNIQDLAIKTENNPNANNSTSPGSNQLTSIDGSTAHVGIYDTAEQITAQGEQLFIQWIEQQIHAYHMTASMAAYIRKNALNLFRRIAKQYVQRIERVGGTVQNNVRQATQLALNNTQNLIAFLLRNYLNFAGGMMQMIGEQVSRVGKNLDSTGTTIAHINLNPFDIVSNVIGSLPNPSHYSEYFRAFGKYLMGETAQNTSDDQQHPQQEPDSNQEKRKGLFSKTMGALSKTLGSWVG